MATGENVLWVVTKRHKDEPRPRRGWRVFRTREAAKQYAKERHERSKVMCYHVDRATWGPEQ